jgi:speckle-type POZ protein
MAAPAAAGAAPSATATPAATRTTITTTIPQPRQYEHQWRLEGITPEFFTAAQAGEKLECPQFSACGVQWQLTLFPNGDREPGEFILVLRLLTKDAVASVLCSALVSFEDAEEDKHLSANAAIVFSTRVRGEDTWTCIHMHEDFVSDLNFFAPAGVLTLTVQLRERGLTDLRPALISVPAPSLAADLAAALASGRDADVTLVCGGERLAAHSFVLCTRSRVFAAQLAEGPLRADASAVPVPPEITPQTLRRLLHFLYTDELEPESPEQASHLLNAADHYDVRRLLAICERKLCAALAVDTVATTLTLADQHGATGLKDAALRFVAANAIAVMATPGWAHLAAARPLLVSKALHTLAAGAPPLPPAAQPQDAGADGAAGGDDAARRVRRRTR